MKMKLNRKGYLIIEVILSTVIALGMAYFLLDITISLRNNNQDMLIKTNLLKEKAIIENVVNNRIRLLITNQYELQPILGRSGTEFTVNHSDDTGRSTVSGSTEIVDSLNSRLIDPVCALNNSQLTILAAYSALRIESSNEPLVACIRFFKSDNTDDVEYYFEYFEIEYATDSQGHVLYQASGDNGTQYRVYKDGEYQTLNKNQYESYLNNNNEQPSGSSSGLQNVSYKLIERSSGSGTIDDDDLNTDITDFRIMKMTDGINDDYWYPIYSTTSDDGGEEVYNYNYYYRRRLTYITDPYYSSLNISARAGHIIGKMNIRSDYLDETFSIHFYLDIN